MKKRVSFGMVMSLSTKYLCCPFSEIYNLVEKANNPTVTYSVLSQPNRNIGAQFEWFDAAESFVTRLAQSGIEGAEFDKQLSAWRIANNIPAELDI